ncbi:barstar family protein [Frondihabitans sp. PAMC 28766]|uniref:barstar family protein n=1 Tax=Frondihabitans sp. PAMC 28766 TaxID=1795630 RepID=UPI0012FF91CB|nr:barstar family protein [Frondihabitans sp. PAMC 28766]
MSAFGHEEGLSHDVGFQLLREGPISLFHRQTLLDADVARLEGAGYQLVRFDAAAWSDEEAMLREIAVALNFPPSPRHSLDGTNDWFWDLVGYEWGWDPKSTGLVILFLHFDRYEKLFPESAWSILDIIARHSHLAALFGQRLICIAQSDDPLIQMPSVGASGVRWNFRETFKKDRLVEE